MTSAWRKTWVSDPAPLKAETMLRASNSGRQVC